MGRSPRLIGREQAREILASALGDLAADVGQLILVSGDAGIGKSAVLSWLSDRATPTCLVLPGPSWEDGGLPPYWPWVQVLRAADRSGSADEHDLGPPEVSLQTDGTIADPVAAAGARLRMFDTVADRLIAESQRLPVVVLLDDLHWADRSSLELLRHVAARVAGHRVLLVGAFRESEAPPALLELMAHAVHLPLLGMTLAETQAMVAVMPGPAPSPAVVEGIWERAGGNPFFVRELVRLLQASGHLDSAQSPRLPDGVVETLGRRLARLSTDCVRLLAWAAVAGKDIDVRLLVDSGASGSEAAARDLLAEARRAGFVQDPELPRFTHDLYREAVLTMQPAATTATINAAIGRTLLGRLGPGAGTPPSSRPTGGPPRVSGPLPAGRTLPGGAARAAGRTPAVGAARAATHLLGGGPEVRGQAYAACLLAAREATAGLGYDDACRYYESALDVAVGPAERAGVLPDLAAAYARAGRPELARAGYLEIAAGCAAAGDAAGLGRAALGLHELGQRSGTHSSELIGLLQQADERLAAAPSSASAAGAAADLGLRSRVLSALAVAVKHAAVPWVGDPAEMADAATHLAQTAGDLQAVALARLAAHDAVWEPGTAQVRLVLATEGRDAADAAGDTELVARATLLRATAQIELGDPAGPEELVRFVALAEGLGHPRGRWAALSRRATYAQIAGRAEESAVLADEALGLGLAIGEPDAFGCFGTLRGSLVALGIPPVQMRIEPTDPVWPLAPLLLAWPAAVRGDLEAARATLGTFSERSLEHTPGLEFIAVGAEVFAAVGTDDQRRWTYDRLLPYAGTHVVVSGCAAYHAAVDHHLGVLAASLGLVDLAREHLRSAVDQHRRLGAAGWLRASERALAAVESNTLADNEFRRIDGHWRLAYADLDVLLPDAKGLHDLWIILGAKGSEVDVRDLIDPDVEFGRPSAGADPILDAQALAAYRARLGELARRIDEADVLGDAADSARLLAERDAILHELAAAGGLGGRRRRLGDDTERARKTVGARVRDSLVRIDRHHPLLARHLRDSVHLGIACAYRPAVPTGWRLS